MLKVIEGNPVLREEHPTALSKGAYVYYFDTSNPMVDIHLNGRFGINTDLDKEWDKVLAALSEALSVGKYPPHIPLPCEVVREARAFFEMNNIYADVREDIHHVRLCVRQRAKYSMTRYETHGVKVIVPKAPWHFEIIPKGE